MNKFFSTVFFLLFSCGVLFADADFDRAKSLYDNGLYAQAMDVLQAHPLCGKDAFVDGYIVMCAQKQHTPGYENLVKGYYVNYASCTLCTEIRKEQAYDLFDQGNFGDALPILMGLSLSDFPVKYRPEFLFKRGYCFYKLGNFSTATMEFEKVDRMMVNDYSAPSQYVIGYISYGDGDFGKALEYFGKAARDERFAPISNYYIINCHYERKNYDYVLDKGVAMFEDPATDPGRKASLARIISESYLVNGNKGEARKYYDAYHDDSKKGNRADYFYAGSLMYSTGEYQQAVENFAKMTEKTDSLGQVAWYETAFSYMGLKNKVSALDAFKNASELLYDRKITEDAFFNYAKLAFDLNGDTSVFARYIATYSDKVRGELIYSYMALTALADKDYQAAIDAYDKIDVLAGQERSNYVNANYLRAVELMNNGSYRKSVPCFKAVTYYSPKDDMVNQLALYGLGEAYYRNAQYDDAASQYTTLYNISGLYGMEEGRNVAYNIAYSYLKKADYSQAEHWFKTYLGDGGGTYSKDAMLRLADCRYARKEYQDAAAAYQEYLDKYYHVNEIYPYYQAAMCYGLSVDPKSRYKKQNTQKINRKIELLSSARGAATASPLYSEALLELGRTLHSVKKHPDALMVFRELVENAPDSLSAAQANLEIGTLKRNVGDVEGALRYYKHVVEAYPEYAVAEDALMAVEAIYQSQNAPAKYVAYLESIGRGATKTDAEKEQMYYSAAQQYYFSDNYKAAIDAFAEFNQTFPESGRKADALFYIAESYRMLSDKEQACDAYEAVFADEANPHAQSALAHYAALNYSMDNFDKAYDAYKRIGDKLGLTRSAFKAKDYQNALDGADAYLAAAPDARFKDEILMIKAKSLLGMSRRDEAFAVLSSLASSPLSAEGAEAAYMVILDCYDRAEFELVQNKVYAFSDSGTRQAYFLAKAFVVLGDTFVELGKIKQAEATFKSVLEGFDNKELADEINMRLDKLAEKK